MVGLELSRLLHFCFLVDGLVLFCQSDFAKVKLPYHFGQFNAVGPDSNRKISWEMHFVGFSVRKAKVTIAK